ncbi:MAG TPA: 3-hydroxyacyl-CoA dehydrogenase NAD-binding domain-containing protein [Candidatus Limnocylindrales bacterium]
MKGQRALIAIVGAGTMGTGIAQVALEAGHEVVIHDVDDGALARGRARIGEGLARRAARLDLDADSIDDWVDGRLANLREAVSLDTIAAEADVVIEAALEDLELKRTIFGVLDRDGSPDAILATNTSALSIDDIAAGLARPERVVGMHFFNPAPVMALVEVVGGGQTAESVLASAAELAISWGKTAVRSADAPGFIVNRVNRAFTLEALAALEGGEANIEAIDAAVRAQGFPMGPFELMDLTGIDVSFAAALGIYEGFRRRGDELAARFRPSGTQERLVTEERLGRKTERGFYVYDGGGARRPAEEFTSAGGPAARGGRDAGAAVADRIRLAIDLEAIRARDDGVATATDIDVALRLGANHPIGPFEHIDHIGGPAVLLARVQPLAGRGTRFAPPSSLGG